MAKAARTRFDSALQSGCIDSREQGDGRDGIGVSALGRNDHYRIAFLQVGQFAVRQSAQHALQIWRTVAALSAALSSARSARGSGFCRCPWRCCRRWRCARVRAVCVRRGLAVGASRFQSHGDAVAPFLAAVFSFANRAILYYHRALADCILHRHRIIRCVDRLDGACDISEGAAYNFFGSQVAAVGAASSAGAQLVSNF